MFNVLNPTTMKNINDSLGQMKKAVTQVACSFAARIRTAVHVTAAVARYTIPKLNDARKEAAVKLKGAFTCCVGQSKNKRTDESSVFYDKATESVTIHRGPQAADDDRISLSSNESDNASMTSFDVIAFPEEHAASSLELVLIQNSKDDVKKAEAEVQKAQNDIRLWTTFPGEVIDAQRRDLESNLNTAIANLTQAQLKLGTILSSIAQR